MTLLYAQTPEGQPSEETSSPLVKLQRVFLSFIKGLFAQVPRGNGYHWEESSGTAQDQEGSDLWIGSETPINPEITGIRPSVVVSRGAAAFHGIGLGDMAYIDQQTGGAVKMDMIPTTLTIHVLSRVKFEAEELAWFVASHIWTLRSEILKGNSFMLYTGQRPQLSAPSPAGSLISGPSSTEDWIAVTISMPVYLQYMSVAIPLNRKTLSEVRMVATATGPQPRVRPRRPLVGTAVFSPEPVTLPTNSVSEAQSSEPLTTRIKT